MRELNNIPFATDADIINIAKTSMEHDTTSHGGSLNEGIGINVDEVFTKYTAQAQQKSKAFEKFALELMN
jgi:hypothetical protein